MTRIPEPLFAVVGPTGAGKTELAMALAELLGGEIVSVDSAQVFTGLDVGTAKPTAEEQARVPHHVIDVISPREQWSAAQYSVAANRAIADLRARKRTPIVCGGTGLWLRALVHGIFEAPEIEPETRRAVRRDLEVHGAARMHEELARVDPIAAARIKPQDPQRIGRALEIFRQLGVPISTLQAEHGFRDVHHRLIGIAIDWPRDQLRDRLAVRARAMYDGGLIEEVERALAEGIAPHSPGLSIIGYRDATRLVRGEIARDAALESTITETRQYAKRQRNWFRSVSEVEWVSPGETPAAVLARLRARVSKV